ncbi:AzlD domain-containing protein [Paraconexibacter antarcticus]|uniref:AzlD domain-containing protein n=1 Tax=Paraconexibacter antarcticus TaxID=2949664 RepID=A0ABY5DZV2_9ACTN|nr:AzlD domain-containing protein [Paraconexibacter antarcticus]UTI66367.1 AzlD domain-containing protein [Paraconexibacter antarcticus]
MTWGVIAGCAIVTALIKGSGPFALGGRPLPARITGIVLLLAPALLAALVVTQTLAHGRHLEVGANTAGVAVAAIAAWRRASILVVVGLAAVVTAGLRAL